MKDIVLDKQVRQDIIGELRGFFVREMDEEISEFRCSLLLDFVLSHVGPHIYNQAIADAHRMMANMIEDLYALEKRAR